MLSHLKLKFHFTSMKNEILFIFLFCEILFISLGFITCILGFHYSFVTSLTILADISSIKGIIYAIIFIISQNKQLDDHHENLGTMISRHLTN